MMTHVEQGELQAYLDGEVTLNARARIESHLHACAPCAAALERQRAAARLFASLIRTADRDAPILTAQAAMAAARRQQRSRRLALSRSALAKAAVMMVGFAALASAAIPGSPVRQWISSALEAVGLTTPAPIPAPAPVNPPAPSAATATAPAEGEQAALSIEPAGGRVLIVLTNVADDAVIRVRLVDSDRAVVQAVGAAAHARFRTGPGRIEVVGIQKGQISIDLPRGLSDGRVEVDGRTIFQKDGDQLHLNQPATTGANSEFIFKGAH